MGEIDSFMTPMMATTPEKDPFLAQLEFWDALYYHEAGHAVAARIFGFPVKRVWVGEHFSPESFGRNEMDARGQRFLRDYLPRTPRAWQRMQDFAVFSIAGIAAEARHTGVAFEKIRACYWQGETNSKDYVAVRSMAQRLVFAGKDGLSDEIQEAYINLWEQRAIGMMSQNHIWRAVEAVVNALQISDGVLDRADLDEVFEEFPHLSGPHFR
jgi:hypothetical protein